MERLSDEAFAKRVVERALHRTLTWWDTDGRQGAVDFRAEDHPTISLEVKQLTDQGLRETSDWLRDEALELSHLSTRLTRYWLLATESSLPTDLRSVVKKAEGLLVEMEQRNIHQSRGWTGPDVVSDRWEQENREGFSLIQKVRHLLGGGTALSFEATKDLPAGFVIQPSNSRISATHPDSFADRILTWLREDDKASNLLSKLAKSTDDQRHAFLYLDPMHKTGIGGSPQHIAGRLPTKLLNLPGRMTHLWIAQPKLLVWRYDGAGSWIDFSHLADL